MAAFTVIDHTELGASAASWSKTSIPSSYDHLLIKASVRTDVSAYYNQLSMRFNNSSATDYSRTQLYAETATPASSRASGETAFTGMYVNGASSLADTFSTLTVWIPNYANTANFKQAFAQTSAENASTTGYTWSLGLIAGLWSSTDNIERIRITAGTGDWMQYSTFTLYGVTGA